MELTELYKLRRSFTIIGITGRTGSGCSKIADLLSNDFSNLEAGLRNQSQIKDDSIFGKKFEICRNYLSYKDNWQKFEIIKYKDVLLFYFLNLYGNSRKEIKQVLLDYYKEENNEDNISIVDMLSEEVFSVTSRSSLIKKIVQLKQFRDIREKEELENLHEIFFGEEYAQLSTKIFNLLEKHGYYRRTCLLHSISCNIRNSGNALNQGDNNGIKYIYSIAELINRLIKAKKQINGPKPTRIVIDSLRNSLEIMFFKERYSAFYMVATKDPNHKARNRVIDRLLPSNDEAEAKRIAAKLLELDSIEYRTKDYTEGRFSSPDVYNCIQKSDIHLLNYKITDLKDDTNDEINSFFSREEQLLKFVSLIQQPGIITPSANERCMQIAFNSKLNSGCISRQVGAVVTDGNYSIKGVGWNDVPSGQTPCNLRSANDYYTSKLTRSHYSKFEMGIEVENVDVEFKYKDTPPHNFPEAVKAYYNNSNTSSDNEHLNGKNCSFCFKAIHNKYENEKNQVHTKSLHAEENAMLQISKYGGQGLKGGILFTTASPCELCSKKAYQLGIQKVIYIDPYPGISDPQILSNERKPVKNLPFNGAIGTAYNKLYEPFMSYKDEVGLMLDIEPKNFNKSKWQVLIDEIKNEELRETLLKLLKEDHSIDEVEILNLIKSKKE